jgi:putative ABC transport system substrate-binding protein
MDRSPTGRRLQTDPGIWNRLGPGGDVSHFRLGRRDFIMVLGGAAACALPAAAQHPPLPVIGYLCPESPGPFASRISAFREGLAEAGYAEGRNVAIEFRWAEGQYGRLPGLATELASRRVAVIAAPGGAPVALAAKTATTTTPIVFEMGGDPVALGVVASMSRPGGNVTGVSSLNVELAPKRLEILHELVPTATAFAVVINPTSPTANSQLKNLQPAAGAMGLQLHVLRASTEQELAAVFNTLPQRQAGGLVFTSDPFFANRSQQLAALAAHHRVPAIHQSRDFALAGGLTSYGGNFSLSHRLAGVYAGRVIKGEKPSDLPVQQVTSIELFINAKAANTLGITVPVPLLGRADVVIE